MSVSFNKANRLLMANILLQVIARKGRGFFRFKDNIAYFWLDGRGRIWFRDECSGKNIYTHYTGRWKHFTGGGDLRNLIIQLRDYITTGKKILYPNISLGPWPDWFCDGDVWGYGNDMLIVRDWAWKLGILEAPGKNSKGNNGTFSNRRMAKG